MLKNCEKLNILEKNKIYTYKNITEVNENIDNNILYLIESKLLGIEDIESKIKIENIWPSKSSIKYDTLRKAKLAPPSINSNDINKVITFPVLKASPRNPIKNNDEA